MELIIFPTLVWVMTQHNLWIDYWLLVFKHTHTYTIPSDETSTTESCQPPTIPYPLDYHALSHFISLLSVGAAEVSLEAGGCLETETHSAE